MRSVSALDKASAEHEGQAEELGRGSGSWICWLRSPFVLSQLPAGGTLISITFQEKKRTKEQFLFN